MNAAQAFFVLFQFCCRFGAGLGFLDQFLLLYLLAVFRIVKLFLLGEGFSGVLLCDTPCFTLLAAWLGFFLFSLCSVLFLQLCRGNGFGGYFKCADKIKVNIYPLPGWCRAPYQHFHYKLVEHGRWQLGKIDVAAHKVDKLIRFQPVGVPVIKL